MQHFQSAFAKFPRLECESFVKEHKAERHARGFTCWGQFVAMLFCQLAARILCGRSAKGCRPVKANYGIWDCRMRLADRTLSYVNAHRPCKYTNRCFTLCGSAVHPRPRFEGGTNFVLRTRWCRSTPPPSGCALRCTTGLYSQRAKGAVKLHLVLDHDGYLPQFAVITTARTRHHHRPHAALSARNHRGVRQRLCRLRVVRDLGERGVYFVSACGMTPTTPWTGNARFPNNTANAFSATKTLPSTRHDWAKGLSGLRRIEVWDEETQRVFVFVTNHLKLAASTIDRIYRERWQIETFFKSLKQLLRSRPSWDQRERRADANLDSINRHAIAALAQTQSQVRLELVHLLALLRSNCLYIAIWRSGWTILSKVRLNSRPWRRNWLWGLA